VRKRLTILLALALTVVMAYGVIGSGAAFLKSVTAQEQIQVGTFECLIVAASPAEAVIAADGKSVSYVAPTINASAPGSAPFAFTVQNTGSIPQTLTVATSATSAPFSIIGAPFAARALAANGSTVYATGVQWTELNNDNLGAEGTVTWTVSCNEQTPPEPLPANTYVFSSTNANNIAEGWANVTAVPNAGSVTLTFHHTRAFYACFEYRSDGNVPEQRLAPGLLTVGPPFAPSIASGFGIIGINDGRYKTVCKNAIGDTSVTVPVMEYVEVRIAAGAEQDEWFDWTRFDALP
jgi:hypothetical protein